jgi:hypothetical protein
MINKTTSIVVATYIQAQEDIQMIYISKCACVLWRGGGANIRIK